MDELQNAAIVVLAKVGDKASHTLTRNDPTGPWVYGERQCFDDLCHCISHKPWRDQNVTDEEAVQIVALFRSKGWEPTIAGF